jgi:hemoglobin
MRTSILAVTVVLALAACKSRQLEKPRTGELSERVGGQDGIDKIVDVLDTAVKADDRLKTRFASPEMAKFKTSIGSFLCETIEADCSYDGAPKVQSMMKVNDEEFGAFMELFIVAMNDVELPQQEQNDLIDAMMSIQGDVVQR